MRTTIRTVLIVSAVVGAIAGLGLVGRKRAHANGKFKEMHVNELATLVAAKDSKLAIYDANPPDFRAKEGIVPGAKLLSSFNKYDVATELPAAKDSKLVFYCANTL
jgi:hypothetical protein